MKAYLFPVSLIIILLGCSQVFSQKREHVWVFGDKAGLDFNGPVPVPITTAMEGFGEAAASVSDADGNLLFYTEGSRVWDRDHNLMSNGANLTGVVSTNVFTPTSSSAQGCLIIPMPATTDKYYVFSLTSMEQGASGNAGKLFYSVVDMSLNGGKGDVVPGESGKFVAGSLSERLTAVVGNRCNIWVVVSGIDTRIRAFEVTHSGVDTTPVISSTGISHDWAGRFVFSGDGTRLAATKCFVHLNGVLGLVLFDFDVNTGLASNPIQLLDRYGGYGVCFSPDNSKLYVYADLSIYQYDLSDPSAAAIRSSEFLLGSSTATDIKLGPDGKVYFRSNEYIGGGSSFGVIHQPDLRGTAAQFETDVFRVAAGTNFSLGLPNIVPVFDFDLDTVYRVKDSFATCLGGSIPLVAEDPDGWDYRWNDGTSGSARTVSSSGTYWVRYFTTPCTYNVDTFHISLPELQVVNSCRNGTAGLAWLEHAAGDTQQYHYTWSYPDGQVISTSDTLKGMPPGDYILRLHSPAGCNSTIAFSISTDLFEVSFTAPDYACAGHPVTFQNSSGPEEGTYLWMFGDGGASADTDPVYTFSQPGEFSVMLVKTGRHCRDTFEKDIVIDDSIMVSFTADRNIVCAGEKVVLSLHPSEDQRIESLWWVMGDEVLNPSGQGGIVFVADEEGLLPVELRASFRACPDISHKDTVRISGFPVVNLGPDTSICPAGPPVILTNLSAVAPGAVFSWSDGSSDASLPAHAPGLYHLTVTSPEGCATTDSVLIRRDCFIEIPNVFAPDGNGLNDYFFPRGLLTAGVLRFSMEIYNRWGQKVYQTSSAEGMGWDGRYNGQEQPQGVYVYRITAEISGTGPVSYQGNVTMIR